MPASGAIKLVDANVWLALTFSDHQHHMAAVEWFDAQPEDSCAFCRITQMALLRHLTNSKIMGNFVRSQKEAWAHYDQLTNDPRVSFLGEPANLEAKLRAFTHSEQPARAKWTDCWLAAIAVGHGVQLVTFDKGLGEYPELDCLIIQVKPDDQEKT